MASEIALTHHERWDGSGYPQQLAGEEIPLTSRIVAIADVYDALTSERPYKAMWPHEKALEYIRLNSGTHFDPRMVALFMENIADILAIKQHYADQTMHAEHHYPELNTAHGKH
jgi:putative two-component system response regulator